MLGTADKVVPRDSIPHCDAFKFIDMKTLCLEKPSTL